MDLQPGEEVRTFTITYKADTPASPDDLKEIQDFLDKEMFIGGVESLKGELDEKQLKIIASYIIDPSDKDMAKFVRLDMSKDIYENFPTIKLERGLTFKIVKPKGLDQLDALHAKIMARG